MPRPKSPATPKTKKPFQPRRGRPARAPQIQTLAPMERIYRLHDRLAAGLTVTAPMIAEEFGVDPITIRRDLDFMEDRLRAPIEWDDPTQTFRYTQVFNVLPRLELTPAEAVAFMITCNVSPAWRSGLGRHLRSVAKKVEPLIAGGLALPYDVARTAIDVPDSIDLAEYRFLDVVAEAKRLRQELRLEYQGLGKTVPEARPRVHPLKVRRFDQGWVVLAWDVERQDYRVFKFCRIRAVATTGATFEPPADFNEAECMRGNLGCYTGRERHTVRVALAGPAALEAIDHPWHESQVKQLRPDGSLEITLELNNLVDVTSRILSWGPDAEALAPVALRERVCAALDATRARYASGSAGVPPAPEKAASGSGPTWVFSRRPAFSFWRRRASAGPALFSWAWRRPAASQRLWPDGAAGPRGGVGPARGGKRDRGRSRPCAGRGRACAGRFCPRGDRRSVRSSHPRARAVRWDWARPWRWRRAPRCLFFRGSRPGMRRSEARLRAFPPE